MISVKNILHGAKLNYFSHMQRLDCLQIILIWILGTNITSLQPRCESNHSLLTLIQDTAYSFTKSTDNNNIVLMLKTLLPIKDYYKYTIHLCTHFTKCDLIPQYNQSPKWNALRVNQNKILHGTQKTKLNKQTKR